MSQFKENTVTFGQVKSGKKLTATFELIGDKQILKIVSNCSCIVGTYTEGSKTVTVTHTVSSIPFHLDSAGVTELPQTKKVIVHYTDESTEELYLKFTIKK